MAVDRNRVVVGSVAALALVLVVGWQWPSSAKTKSPQATVTTGDARPRPARPAAGAQPSGPVEVRLHALAGGREEPGHAARNPFRYQARPAPPPPKIAAPV